MIECYLQVASRNISDPCVASREGSKKDRKVCHKSSCLLLLSFSLDFNCWYRIFVLVLDTGLCPDYLFTIILSKLQYEVLSWKICSLSGCADKIFLTICRVRIKMLVMEMYEFLTLKMVPLALTLIKTKIAIFCSLVRKFQFCMSN